DAFGKFGASDVKDNWDDEARRYYFNIVGKYGVQVQSLLKKVGGLDIQTICPLHGVVIADNLSHYIGLYDTWSKYEAECDEVFIAYTSVYGNTKKAVETLAEILKKNGVKVQTADLGRTDMSENMSQAFKCSKIVLATTTYNAGIFPPMEDFLHHLKAKNFQNKTVGLVENGTWVPLAAKGMTEILNTMKNINIVEPVVSIKSALNAETVLQIEKLAEVLSK
ncbi:MAG: flavodoxin domain-containing protein, partial [Clostridia bacterium]